MIAAAEEVPRLVFMFVTLILLVVPVSVLTDRETAQRPKTLPFSARNFVSVHTLLSFRAERSEAEESLAAQQPTGPIGR
jgi:hypothetical protein